MIVKRDEGHSGNCVLEFAFTSRGGKSIRGDVWMDGTLQNFLLHVDLLFHAFLVLFKCIFVLTLFSLLLLLLHFGGL